MHRFARQRDLPVNLKPMRLMVWSQLAHEAALSILQSGLRFKGRINLKESIIDGPTLSIKKHLNDTEPLHQSGEQCSVPFFRLA